MMYYYNIMLLINQLNSIKNKIKQNFQIIIQNMTRNQILMHCWWEQCEVWAKIIFK